ncbi:BQ2448_2496 [Microbotryum intermedium]|uniref:Glutamate decarboxylase n=1 Tax=Microbotryum intermedium TaxID=269621 RepID=A0A238FEF1_9BASI|nr:BQ2448_2496 [Microbotryum intermedium]
MATLARQLNAEKLLQHSHEHAKAHGRTNARSLMEREGGQKLQHPNYGTGELPKHSIPSKGTEPVVAYNLIHDELSLDGSPLLNLASFVHTHMDEYGDKLALENIAKNLIDTDASRDLKEYPATVLLHTRCISMLAKLWHADETKNATGTATTGSSEAIQLAGLAMKRRWQDKRRKAGKDEYRPGPNIVMGANAQVALEKFARYFEVEARLVPVSKETNYIMSPERAMEYVDENTIGIFIILGSTYTGAFEDVEGMSKLLDEYEAKTGHHVPIHVDAASGGFVAPFAYPKHVWDFRLPRVCSINTSGHKFGKAYVGVGWVIWRDAAHLPEDLVFKLTYLGSVEYSFSLNFSRPAHPIICQYYNFIRFGFEGYRAIALHDAKNARLLARALNNSKYYTVISDLLEPSQPTGMVDKAAKAVGLSENIEDYRPSLPVVAFRFSDEFKKDFPYAKQKNVQTLMRAKGWIIPNYELPPDVSNVEILRVVVREQFSEDLVERLVIDLIEITEDLIKEATEKERLLTGRLVPSEHKVKGTPDHNEKQAATQDQKGVQPTGHSSPASAKSRGHPTMAGHDLAQRLAHPHYIANGLLSLPLPLLLIFATDADLHIRCLSLAGPMLLVALVLLRDGSREAETNTELVTWNLRIFNLFGLVFTRSWLGLGWIHVGAYLLTWFVVSFVFPQPPYLGPSKMVYLDTEVSSTWPTPNIRKKLKVVLFSQSFDEEVLIIPPMSKFSSSETSPISATKITEIASDPTTDDYEKRRKNSTVWHVVLFHVEWSRKSRELEITLSRMSNQLASPTLSFVLVTPESTPRIFYDLDLSTSATLSFQDLPLVALYHRGELVDRLPKNAKQIALERKQRKEEMRKQGWSSKSLREGRRKREMKKLGPAESDEESESGSGTDESEDEREVQTLAARQRYKWDLTQGSIERAFGLNEKSKAGSKI